MCSPVEGVRVQIQHLQWSSIRLISKFMNRQPLFILSYYTNLKCIEADNQKIDKWNMHYGLVHLQYNKYIWSVVPELQPASGK